MNALHQELIQIGERILSLARSELYLSMRFLDIALSALEFTMNLQTRSVATDGVHLFYNPTYLAAAYRDDPVGVNRTYLHLVLHGIFRHITGCGERDRERWDLSCDIAAESILDSMDYPCVARLVTDRRQEFYDMLDVPVRNAENIYEALESVPYPVFREMEREFRADDHRFWARQDDERQSPQPQENDSDTPPAPDRDEVDRTWRGVGEKTKLSMQTFHREQALHAGDLLRQLRIETRTRYDFRRFLQKFALFREEVRIDPESFDYGFYSYGLQLYGNLALVEQLEYREEKKIHDFVIAVDTSGSCSGALVERFLEQTVAILRDSGSFFHRVNVHILQCDCGIQADWKITDPTILAGGVHTLDVRGSGDTDFRPVFDYVDRLIEQGEFSHLQGLLFFTDGYGVFPRKRPAYPTAFLFYDDTYAEHLVPPWAQRLVFGALDIIRGF